MRKKLRNGRKRPPEIKRTESLEVKYRTAQLQVEFYAREVARSSTRLNRALQTLDRYRKEYECVAKVHAVTSDCVERIKRGASALLDGREVRK